MMPALTRILRIIRVVNMVLGLNWYKDTAEQFKLVGALSNWQKMKVYRLVLTCTGGKRNQNSTTIPSVS